MRIHNTPTPEQAYRMANGQLFVTPLDFCLLKIDEGNMRHRDSFVAAYERIKFEWEQTTGGAENTELN